jgi:formamidopyrimidine-DNA glycosylase
MSRDLDFELPEVETIRRDLEREVIGRKIKAAEAASMKCLRRYHTRKAFTSQLAGAKIADVRRVGLYLVIELSTEVLLVLSLGSSGSPRRNPNKHPKVAGTEVVISFTQYGQLRFVDTRGTGQMFVVPADEFLSAVPEVTGYGLDPVATPISWTEMGRQLLQRDTKLKTLITDDRFVVGIGDIYADEILFEAGLRFDRVSNTLSTQEIRRLHRSLVGTMHDAMKYRGTSVPDRPFLDPFGQPGGYAGHLKVWGRHGELSERSRAPIKRTKFRGTWTYYCDTQV